MKEPVLIKKNKRDFFAHEDKAQLLLKHKDMEVMSQVMRKGNSVWLEPAEDKETLEFFYILKGKIKMNSNMGEEILADDDSFYIYQLENNVSIEVLEDTNMIYLTNRPLFDNLNEYENKLYNLIKTINYVDKYTFEHSKRVKNYVQLLYDNSPYMTDVALEDVIIAACLHDIGKSKLPARLLNKEKIYSDSDYKLFKNHTIYGAEMLQEKYNSHIVSIVLNHHERLDGSGYFGEKNIDLATSTVIVADEFDDLTTESNNNRLSYVDAANKLVNEQDKYDSRVTKVLQLLVQRGIIS